MFALLGKLVGWLGLGVGLVGTSVKSITTNLMIPLFSFLLNNWLKVLLFGIFGALALNLIGTLISYLLYNMSVALHLGLGAYVTPFTIGILINSIFGLIFLFIGLFIFKLLKQ